MKFTFLTKKIMIALLAVSMILTCTQCSSKTEETTEAGKEVTVEKTVEDTEASETQSTEETGTSEEASETTTEAAATKAKTDAEATYELDFSCDGKSVTLSWDAVEDAQGYQIERQAESEDEWGEWSVIQEETTETEYEDTEVEKGTTYRYRCIALKEDEDEYSVAKKITVKVPKILIMDNDTDDAKRVKKMLKRNGFKVNRKNDIDEVDVDDYDGLVIPGGNNITPEIYGAERDSHTYGTNKEKDEFQIAAVKMFMEAKKPILGICRGEQLVNVALGGTINQHIGTEKGNSSGEYEGWHKGYRDITIKEGSWLYDTLGAELSVKHSHHQCVEKLGEGLIATQWDKDSGIIEGYEHESLPIYGLQWHPDHMEEKGDEVSLEFRKICQEQ